MRYDSIIVHYHEIALKQNNRQRFEEQLRRNIESTLVGLVRGPVRRKRGSIEVVLREESPVETILERLQWVFGIRFFAPALHVDPDIEPIKERAWELVKERPFKSFGVRTQRTNKAFPMNSMEISGEVGAHIKELSGAAVNLTNPDLWCNIRLAENRAVVFAERVEGAGGLPAKSGELAASLLSSGIDSPVAAYRIMRRGERLIFIHFHSYPYTSKRSQENVESLVKILARHQGDSRLFLVPLLEIQKKIVERADPALRVLLYRRAMVRLAERIAIPLGAAALVTGENVGQVASQTLSNIRAIDDVATLPILRPVAGDDKEQIINSARRIGTYDISIEPDDDCCSLFVPRRPETRARLEIVRAEEAQVGLDAELDRALAAVEERLVPFSPS
ncbi:MAG: tRNA 4-thiouridine(8) synthase ThiI [Candidatus Schekmanbacteria bacterium]|nr:tRNA 4-thiouridine(8) synthase ThiI [Candidatus Schekmanbacteria bacterium]